MQSKCFHVVALSRGCLVLAVLGVASVALAHPLYQRSIGVSPGPEVGYDVDIAGTNEGVCVVGRTAVSTTAPEDIFLGRFQPDGATIWTRRIVANDREVGYTMHQTRDGGFIVGAETSNAVPATAGIVLMKLTGLGTTTWAARYGGSAFVDFPAGVSARETRPDTLGNTTYTAVGRRQPALGGPMLGVLIRVSSGGAPIFQRTYNYFTPAGQPAPLSFADFRENGAGFVVCGHADERQFGGVVRPFIMQVDNGGNPIWIQTYADPNVPTDMTADGIDLETSGDIVVSGRSEMLPPQRSLFVMRTDALGNPLWATRVRSVFNGFQAVRFTHNRKIVVAGTFETAAGAAAGATVTKFDPGGALIYGQRYGAAGPEAGHGICAFDCGHGFNVTGLSNIPLAPGTGDVYLLRTIVNGRSGCFEAPFGVGTPVPILPRPAFVQVGTQNEFITFAHQNQVFATQNVVHCRRDTCPADIDDGSGTGKPDDGVDINDLLLFLGLFDAGDICADLDDDGADPQSPDGGVDINDLLFFLFHFDLGC